MIKRLLQIEKAENKLNDHLNFYTKLMNEPSGEVKLISTKGLTKDLMNEYSILNGEKYFGEDGSKN